MNKYLDFEGKAKKHLDQSVDELSPDISRRLQQARYAALEKAKPYEIWSLFPKAATVTLAIAIVSISLFLNFNQSSELDMVIALETEMDIFTSNDNLELMEDLEFFEWLIETDGYAS